MHNACRLTHPNPNKTKTTRAVAQVRQVQTFGSMDLLRIPIGQGSGLVWDTDGHVVTSAHVVRGSSEVKARGALDRAPPRPLLRRCDGRLQRRLRNPFPNSQKTTTHLHHAHPKTNPKTP
jgi:hypothetical protein